MLAGRQPYLFAVTGLPSGLSVDAGGRIVGTPGAVGEFPVTVRVTDRLGGSASRQVTLSVVAALTAPTATPVVGVVGMPLTVTLRATGGKRPYAFAVTGLPPGLTQGETTAKIVGTPTAVGKYALTITVSDVLGGSAPGSITLEIRARLAFGKQLARPLPTAKVGKKYAFRIPVTGATRPTFLAAGSFPPGLRLNERTGLLSGTLLRPGRYRIRIYVLDRPGVVITRPITLRVRR